MANTFTNLNYTILSTAVFEEFVAQIAPVSSFSVDVSPAPAERGQTVQALFMPSQSPAVTFTDGVGYVMQDSQAESVEVVLDNHLYVSTALTDTQLTNYPQVSLEAFGKQKGFQLAKSIFQTITGGFAAGSGVGQYSEAYSPSGSASSFSIQDIINIGAEADDLYWPETGRTIIVNPAQYASLVSSNELLAAYALGSDVVIRTGVIPDILGFKIVKSAILPSNISNGIAVMPAALAVAFRPLLVAEGHLYSVLETLTSPEGYVLTNRRWYSRDLGEQKNVWESVFGFNQGLPSAAIIF